MKSENWTILCGVLVLSSAWPGVSRAQLSSGRYARPAAAPSGDRQRMLSTQEHGVAAGDVNGDGFADVVVGVVAVYAGVPSWGEARVRLGCATGLASAAWRVFGEQEAARFGSAVAGAGDVNGDGFDDVLVGAPGFSVGGTSGGRAYLFLGSAQGLAHAAAWSVDGDQDSAQLGATLASAGDVNGDGFDDVLVAAPGFDGAFRDEGRVLLYLGGAAGLAATPAWSAVGGRDDARFGVALAGAVDVDGDGFDDALVGAPGDDLGAPGGGRAYLFPGSPVGLLASPSWTVEGSTAGEGLGWSVAVGDVNADGFGDVALASPHPGGGPADVGRVRVHRGGALGLEVAPSWSASGEPGSGFGRSVACADPNDDGADELLVGAPDDDLAAPDGGQVLVFRGSTVGLLRGARWTKAGDLRSQGLGTSVAGAGDVDGDGRSELIAGVRGRSTAGAIQVVAGSEVSMPEYDWRVTGELSHRLGWTAANAGDVDADGYADVVVTTHGDFGTAVFAMLYRGSPSGLSASAHWVFRSPYSFITAGNFNAAGAGDVNGDGYADVVVGAPNHHDSAGGPDGRVFVFHGSSTGLSVQPDWLIAAEQPGEYPGHRVVGLRDVDGDGYADVGVASNYYDGTSLVGRVQVFLGSPAGLAATPAWTRLGSLGMAIGSVAPAGDVNADGFDDLLVLRSPGRSELHLGSSAGPASSPAWTAEGDAWTAGDVDADGFDDVVIANHRYQNPEQLEGAAALHNGSAAGLATSPSWFYESNLVNACFGYVARTAGDVNGDGFADVLVTANCAERAYLFLGSAQGLGLVPARIVSEPEDNGFGESGSSAGDVDGDGLDDWLVGAPYSGGGTDAFGRVFSYFGSR